MNTETIFSSYKPVEQYWALVQAAHTDPPVPAVALRGIDAFLMRQLVACYPTLPTLIDLAGAATLGASTILWASMRDSVQRIVSAEASWDDQPDTKQADWRALVNDALPALNIQSNVVQSVDQPLDQPGAWQSVTPTLNRLSPLFVALAQPHGTPTEIASRIEWALSLHPNSVILLLPIGATGDSATLEAALSVCKLDSLYRLSPMREVSPFFAMSQLAVISRRDDANIPAILDRLRALYDGNFNYLALAEENVKFHLQNTKIQSIAITQVTPGEAAASDGTIISPTLTQRIIKRVRTLGKRLLGAPTIEHRMQYVKAMLPSQMQVGETYECSIRVRNDDPKPWYTPEQSKNSINIAYHWRSEKGEMLVKEGQRSPLLAAVFPGETATLPFKITMPGQPGRYQLEIDFVHEGVAWFSDCGAPGPTFAVDVLA